MCVGRGVTVRVVHSILHSRLQITPASSLCAQLCAASSELRHTFSLDSLPKHLMSSRKMGPGPGPNCARNTATAPDVKNTMCMVNSVHILKYTFYSMA